MSSRVGVSKPLTAIRDSVKKGLNESRNVYTRVVTQSRERATKKGDTLPHAGTNDEKYSDPEVQEMETYLYTFIFNLAVSVCAAVFLIRNPRDASFQIASWTTNMDTEIHSSVNIPTLLILWQAIAMIFYSISAFIMVSVEDPVETFINENIVYRNLNLLILHTEGVQNLGTTTAKVMFILLPMIYAVIPLLTPEMHVPGFQLWLVSSSIIAYIMLIILAIRYGTEENKRSITIIRNTLFWPLFAVMLVTLNLMLNIAVAGHNRDVLYNIALILVEIALAYMLWAQDREGSDSFIWTYALLISIVTYLISTFNTYDNTDVVDDTNLSYVINPIMVMTILFVVLEFPQIRGITSGQKDAPDGTFVLHMDIRIL
jgi:hypothetical protein